MENSGIDRSQNIIDRIKLAFGKDVKIRDVDLLSIIAYRNQPEKEVPSWLVSTSQISKWRSANQICSISATALIEALLHRIIELEDPLTANIVWISQHSQLHRWDSNNDVQVRCADCKIYGVEKAESFQKFVPREDLLKIISDIWKNPNKYSDTLPGSEDAYYSFLKFLWVHIPGKEEDVRLVDCIAIKPIKSPQSAAEKYFEKGYIPFGYKNDIIGAHEAGQSHIIEKVKPLLNAIETCQYLHSDGMERIHNMVGTLNKELIK